MQKFMVRRSNLGIFILRVVLGVIFIAHGYGKLQGIAGVISFFGSIGLAPFWAYLVSWTELLSGIAMVLGIFTTLAGYLIAIVMIVAIALVKKNMGFMGGYEIDLIFLASGFAIALSGPGMGGLWSFMGGCKHCDMYTKQCTIHS